jgi:hypothetical protein
VLQETVAAALLAALSARPAGALFATPTCHLFTAVSQAITPTTPVSAFTEASFTGYVAVTLGTLLGPILLPSNDGLAVQTDADFLSTAHQATSQNILGYWIDNASTVCYMAEQFLAPIPIVNLGDFISLDVIFAVVMLLTTN